MTATTNTYKMGMASALFTGRVSRDCDVCGKPCSCIFSLTNEQTNTTLFGHYFCLIDIDRPVSIFDTIKLKGEK